MKKLFLSAILFSYLISSDEIIDYQIFKSYTQSIDTKNIIYKKEIFFGLKEDYERQNFQLLNTYVEDIKFNDRNKSNYLTPSIGTGIGLFGGGGSGLGVSFGIGIPLFLGNLDNDQTIEYLRVISIKDKNENESKEFSLFITENENYDKSDIRDILNKENKK